jgi:hypothetical protein
MGYVKHDAVIVTLWEECDDELADLKAALRAIEEQDGCGFTIERLLVGAHPVCCQRRSYVRAVP